MLRIYAMMGMSRRGLITAMLLGLVGVSTIGLDVVRVICEDHAVYLWYRTLTVARHSSLVLDVLESYVSILSSFYIRL